MTDFTMSSLSCSSPWPVNASHSAAQILQYVTLLTCSQNLHLTSFHPASLFAFLGHILNYLTGEDGFPPDTEKTKLVQSLLVAVTAVKSVSCDGTDILDGSSNILDGECIWRLAMGSVCADTLTNGESRSLPTATLRNKSPCILAAIASFTLSSARRGTLDDIQQAIAWDLLRDILLELSGRYEWHQDEPIAVYVIAITMEAMKALILASKNSFGMWKRCGRSPRL